MANMQDIAEQLVASALVASPTNLPGLASLHETLQTLERQAGESANPTEIQVCGAAQSTAQLVERIILREVTDAQGAIEQLCQQVADIQALIAGTGSSAIATSPSPATAQANTAIRAAAHSAPTTSAPAPAESASNATEGEPLPKGEDLPLVADFLTEAREHLAAAEGQLLKLEEHTDDGELVNAVFRGFHTIKGVAGFLNLRQIGQLAHAAETVLDLGRKGDLAIAGAAADVVLDAVDLAKALLTDLETAVKAVTPIPANARLAGLLERLEALASGSSLPSPSAPSAAVTATPPAVGQSPSKEVPVRPTESGGTSAGSASCGDATVKVATTRLDALINMVGELVIAQAMVSQDMAQRVGEDQRLARNLSHLGKITRELQDLTMAMRMVPIQGVFQKMSRLVRDLVRKAGKEIALTIEGGETEVDRNLVEAIADPLVHMVRNAADHGIEPPEERAKAGKSRAGRVALRAYHQSGNIVVEITDDGRGLNKQRILAKARQAGLVREGQELAEQDIFRLIFAPGLSTADKITDVSGRGVGMDVVRRNVEALRGRIDITSQEGRGSTFTIRLPLTLAVIDGLVIKVGTSRYILPITSIEQSLRPRAAQLSTVQNRGEMCMIREHLMPVVRLHRLFNVTPRTINPCEALLVVVQDGARRCCLLVDELLGQQQVVIKSLGEAAGSVRGVSGGAILGDGTISLILDVPGLIDLATAPERVS